MNYKLTHGLSIRSMVNGNGLLLWYQVFTNHEEPNHKRSLPLSLTISLRKRLEMQLQHHGVLS